MGNVCRATRATRPRIADAWHQISKAPQQKPDSSHAIVVIGIGLDVSPPFPEFVVTFDEYSVEKRAITGNCFRYNRIDAEHPEEPPLALCPSWSVFELII